MAGPPKHREKYTKGDNTIFYSVYAGKYGGDDVVLQHQIHGVETVHITIHPGQPPKLRNEKNRPEASMRNAVANGMDGYTPEPSARVKAFLRACIGKI